MKVVVAISAVQIVAAFVAVFLAVGGKLNGGGGTPRAPWPTARHRDSARSLHAAVRATVTKFADYCDCMLLLALSGTAED